MTKSTSRPAATDDDANWLTSTQCADRYRVESRTFQDWSSRKNFPDNARRPHKPGSPATWNVTLIDAWLRARPRHRSQRPCRWWPVLGIEGYPDRVAKKPVAGAPNA